MSVSPTARQDRCQTNGQTIPWRKVVISDPAQMPEVYSSTPGGTVYGTTPGGTKIIYERSFLMALRESPISKTPPKCSFPSGMLKGSTSPPRPSNIPYHKRKNSRSASIDENCETFRMDL